MRPIDPALHASIQDFNRHNDVPVAHRKEDRQGQRAVDLVVHVITRHRLRVAALATANADSQARLEARRAAWPLADALNQWLRQQLQRVPDGSATARAIDYSLKRWAALTRYLDDGDLPIDNNWVENRIRPNGLDPYAYLRDVLERLPMQPAEIAQFLPTVSEAGEGLLLAVFTTYQAYFHRMHGRLLRIDAALRDPDRLDSIVGRGACTRVSHQIWADRGVCAVARCRHRSVALDGTISGFKKSIREKRVISIEDIYNQDINFLFGSGASFGLLPTLQLQVQNGIDDRRYTLEELATKFEREKDRRLIPLFMHYYANCIRPAEELRLDAVTTEPGATVIKNYRTFLHTALEMVKRRKALDRRCNVFTTNYDGCFPLVADALIKEGHIDFVLNDGARGFTRRILQARNFGSYLCHAGVFGRYQSSIPQINLIHLHGSVYWSKADAAIRVDYDLKGREGLLDAGATAQLQPFSDALNNPASTLANVPDPGFTDDALNRFWAKYELMPIVNPTKWKFHETVYEEHYYQMLRLLSYELEKPNAVLITFGFSFADEHILNLVMRSLSNPRLQVFVCCFNSEERTVMQDKFKGHRSVKCMVVDDGVMNFSAFNEKVLAWPDAADTVDAPAGAAPAAAGGAGVPA